MSETGVNIVFARLTGFVGVSSLSLPSTVQVAVNVVVLPTLFTWNLLVKRVFLILVVRFLKFAHPFPSLLGNVISTVEPVGALGAIQTGFPYISLSSVFVLE